MQYLSSSVLMTVGEFQHLRGGMEAGAELMEVLVKDAVLDKANKKLLNRFRQAVITADRAKSMAGGLPADESPASGPEPKEPQG